MKAAEYIETHYGTHKFAKLLIERDAIGIMDLMDNFSETKAEDYNRQLLMDYEEFGCTPDYWEKDGKLFAQEQTDAYFKSKQ